MGVPAFYRWVQEKYPRCVVNCIEDPPIVIEGELHHELVDSTQPNPNEFEVDNLYIDMNGLIHPCAHPENGEAPRTEEEMYRRIMAYVDRLFAAVRPRKVLYLAIDGVAPRAKMNQQRARRFRSAKEAEDRLEIEKEAIEYMKAMGHIMDDKISEASWDSNVITPGTKFMSKLAKYLRFYIRDRVNQNEAWKSIKVILSDASVPGEGEHKLMSFVRTQRSQPGYDPNQHHVLHGLDADLIMLGLATHEVKFSILREEVLFGKQKYERDQQLKQKVVLDANGVPGSVLAKRKRGEFGEHDGDAAKVELVKLQFLHIATLREYLCIEFQPLSEVLPFPYDFERIVDDFVFLCFFVGNDFLPHLPSLDIRDGALDLLILIYAQVLSSLGGYLTDAGNVNLKRVGAILSSVGAIEDTVFQRKSIKQEDNEKRRISRLPQAQKDQIAATAAKGEAIAIKKRRLNQIAAKYKKMTPEEAVKAKIEETVQSQLDQYRAEKQDHVRLGEPGWKDRYYSDKLKAKDIEHGGGRERVYRAYVEGLCWVMKYYYCGCASWHWFYPFHYAPFASDLTNIEHFEIRFHEGKPFRPFEQLMGVFPAASAHAIPKPFRSLMTDPESPIIDFYPKEIPVDPNGKSMPWQWVVLLPFIDEKRLLEAMEPRNALLTKLEEKRNARWGKEVIFFHSMCCIAKNELPTTESMEVTINTAIAESFTGHLLYVESLYFSLGSVVPSPEAKQQHLMNIPNNQCYSFQYKAPNAQPHECRILENAIVPKPVLVEHSDRVISMPFFGHANINVVDLAGPLKLTNACLPRSARSRGDVAYNRYGPPPSRNGAQGRNQTSGNAQTYREQHTRERSNSRYPNSRGGSSTWSGSNRPQTHGRTGDHPQRHARPPPPPTRFDKPFKTPTNRSNVHYTSGYYASQSREQGGGPRAHLRAGRDEWAPIQNEHRRFHAPPPPHQMLNALRSMRPNQGGIDQLKEGLRTMHKERGSAPGT